jgi:AAA+ ATPase superfamily predicted ATPase
MNPIEASALLATIIGLICNWKNERAAQATDRYQDFMAWLLQHNFNELSERIYQSEELQRDLATLLQQDLSVISTKLDTIVCSISAVADKIDSLSQISRTLGADTNELSEQATEIIKIFDQLEAQRMIYSNAFHQCIYDFKAVAFRDKRFILADIQSLEKMSFLRRVDHNNNGDPIYVITRQGSSFAQQLPEISL